MNGRRLLTGLFAVLLALAWYEPTGAQAPAPAGSPELNYAKARLAVAQQRLERARQLNARAAETVTSQLMAQFAADVELCQQQVGAISAGRSFDSFELARLRDEAALAASQAAYDRAVEQNRRAPLAVTRGQIDRLRLEIELLQARIALARSLQDAPAETKLRWQVSMLQDEVAEIKELIGVIDQDRVSQF